MALGAYLPGGQIASWGTVTVSTWATAFLCWAGTLLCKAVAVSSWAATLPGTVLLPIGIATLSYEFLHLLSQALG